jgi:small-conductance mechanosensitive channel
VAEAASPSAQRSSWERFWSGSAARSADDGSTPVSAAPGRAAAAAALIAPVAHGASTVWAHAAPYAEAGAVVAGTFAANRVAHWALNKFAAGRDIDRHQMAAIRLVTSVLLWTGATVAALHVGGAPPELTTTVFGAGGTILTLGLRDILGNLIQGVNFLVTRPYTIGARIQVDDKVGTVSDLSLTGVVLRKDDGAELKIRHAALAAKPVIVFGAYQFPDASLHLGRISVPAKPKFDGVAGAVWSSLNRKFWISAAALAALLVVPHFVGFLAAGWAATVVQYALAGATAWTTQIIAAALGKAVDKLAERNGWRVETRVISRLVAQAAVWAVGGGAALRLVGVSWTMLGASVGLTTLGVGLASNNFFGTVVQGGEVLFAKPFKIGDRLKISTFDGVVEDMTLYHVVLKLDEGRHALIPYAVVRDALLDVSHPAPPTKEDKK